MLVAFGSGKYDINPYPHCFRTGRHQIQRPVGGLDAKRQRRVGTAHGLAVIDVDVPDGLEAERAARRRTRLELIGVVVEAVATAVEDEPPPVPRAQLAAHLGQVTVTGAGRDLDVRALSQVVSRGLDELTQVERRLAYR